MLAKLTGREPGPWLDFGIFDDPPNPGKKIRPGTNGYDSQLMGTATNGGVKDLPVVVTEEAGSLMPVAAD